MRKFLITASLMAGSLAAAIAACAGGNDLDPISVSQAKPGKTDKIEGRWIVVSGTVDGDEQDLPGAKVDFAKGLFNLEENNGETQKAAYKVDTSKTPAHIDFTATDGPKKGEVLNGIFVFEENRLKICLARPGNDRPTDLSSTEGSGQILIILEPAKSQR